MTTPQVDNQWLDYYALLDVPVGADEDTIRKRIGRVYSEAAANSDHRNLARRQYFQALVERVLPQCRRVLLDTEWRARYDRQHTLHQIGDPAAQDYVAFIASMRGDGAPVVNEALLPQRAQEEIQAARQVVETALSGAELDLLPSQSLSSRVKAPVTPDAQTQTALSMAEAPAALAQTPAEPVAEPVVAQAPAAPRDSRRRRAVADAESQPYLAETPAPAPPIAPAPSAPAPSIQAQVSVPDNRQAARDGAVHENRSADAPASQVAGETHRQPGEPARATVITAQEAADIRRRRASNPNAEPFVAPAPRGKTKHRSRVVIEKESARSKRKLSPTSLNLMVAITGVLLTITIQRFAATPAIATSAGRTPIFVAVAPELQGAIENASVQWEKTPEGSGFDIVVQSLDSSAGVRRVLGKSGELPDAWIPASAAYAARYNQLAPAAKRPPIEAGTSIAQTPMVLVARSDRAAGLRRRFPDRKIASWAALREAVAQEGAGHFGLSDPRSSAPGAIARFSMAREWGETNGQSTEAAAKNPRFWKWMADFEENVPSAAPAPDAMVKDLVLGTTGRFWWAVSYESDALHWMAQGKPIELFYLPRTGLADHPFCPIERVGAPVEVAAGRASFARYLQGTSAQKAMLQSGLRPTEISPSAKIENNPFTQPATQKGGARLEDLPRDERINFDALSAIQSKWSEFYG